MRAIHDLRAIRRPPCAAIVSGGVGKLRHVGAIDVHRVDVEVTTLERREHHPRAIRRKHTFGGVDVVVREPAHVGAITVHREDVELVERPDVAFARIRLGWADAVVHMAAAEEQSIAAGNEPAARGLAVAVGHPVEPRSIGAHHILLIAGATVARRLERDPLAVVAEIRFGIFTTVGDLADVGEMWLARVAGAGNVHTGRRRGRAARRRRR